MALFILCLLSSLIAGGEAFVTPGVKFSPRLILASKNFVSTGGVDGRKRSISQMQPMSNFVLVKMNELGLSQTSGGIMLPEDKMAKWKPMKGTIVSCGTGNSKDSEGRDMVATPMPDVGDSILFKNNGATEISDVDGSKHLLIRNEDIMLVYTDRDDFSLTRLDNLHPTYDRLLVQPIKAEETTSGGIFLPQASTSSVVVEAKVLSVGKSCNQAPYLSSTPIVKGDVVVYNKHHGSSIEIEGGEYSVVKVAHCLAKY